ncbi:AraC family transcriptional regulator [Paenibacillus solanacearum]|nr:AraC family transcriptional regulator [Paenibacillus solanacearum]
MQPHVHMLKREKIIQPGQLLFMSRVKETFFFPIHAHDFIEITYCAEGSGFHYINEEIIPVKRGDLFVLPIGNRHIFRPASASKDATLIVYNCVFPHELLFDLGPLLALDPAFSRTLHSGSSQVPVWSHYYDKNGEIYKMLERMYIEYNVRNIGYLTMLRGLFVQLMSTLQRCLFSTLLPEEEKNHELVALDEILNYIKQNCSQSLSLSDLSTRSGLSISQFQRMFKKGVGRTFVQYLQNCRIESCCQMLQTSDYTIEYIAYACGYQDMKFFHKLFKDHTGVTPKQYRNGQSNQLAGTP